MSSNQRFVVTFLKTVCTDFGKEKEINQRSIEVFGEDEQEAVEKAKAEFCRLDHVHHWSHHADRYRVGQPEFPS